VLGVNVAVKAKDGKALLHTSTTTTHQLGSEKGDGDKLEKGLER